MHSFRFSRICACALSIALLFTSLPARADEAASEDFAPSAVSTSAILSGGPDISAEAAIVMEVNSSAVLYAKAETAAKNPVSLTKLMTCLLAFEELSLTDTVSCSYKSIHGIGSNVTRIGLVEKERLSVSDALYAILVASADEASYALGETVGGNMTDFLAMMNKRMQSLGGVNTNFTSATGTDKVQDSCAYDLGLVACALTRYPAFYKMAGAKWYEIPATNLNDARVIAQTHKFIRQTLKYDFAIAGKSGGSDADGKYALCTYAAKGGMTLVAIVLGSPTNDGAYTDSVNILNYAFENYEVHDMLDAEGQMNDTFAGLFQDCPMFTQSEENIISIDGAGTIVLPLGADLSQLTKSIDYALPEEYVHGSNVIGHVRYLYQGKQAGYSNIIFYNSEYPMSQSQFDAVWPAFLIPPSLLVSQGGPGVALSTSNTQPATSEIVTPSVTAAPSKNDSEALYSADDSASKLPDYLAAGLFLILFIPCLVIIYIVLPNKRKKNTRRRMRR